eukprot:m.284829 g.284829  ORF g.284829 m.284829 type:complete len:378 (+) comp22914_c0_seq8:1803-2936(+)
MIRVDFSWNIIEKEKGQYNFTAYDGLVAQLDESSVKAIFIFAYSNPLYDHGLSPASPEAVEAFANFAVAGVQRYKGKGYIWECYNEPNGHFWTPRANATAYATMAVAMGKALEKAGMLKTEMFVGPTTSAFPMEYIEAVFQGGVLSYFSAISVHPYRGTNPETVLPDYQNLTSLAKKYGARNPRILSSEWGYSTCIGSCAPGVANKTTERGQAKYLSRMFLVNTFAGCLGSIFYDWHDDGSDPTMREQNFGVTHNKHYNSTYVYEPKPAYFAAQTLKRLLGHSSYNSRIPVSDSDVFVLTFDHGAKVAAWSAAVNASVSVSFASPMTGCYSRTAMLGDAMSQVCSSGGTLTLTVTDEPQYLTHTSRRQHVHLPPKHV